MRPALALLVAAIAAVTLGLALAFAAGGLAPWSAFVALAGGLLVGALAHRQIPPPTSDPAPKAPKPPHPIEWLLLGIFALASFRAFFWLLFPRDGEWHVLSPNNLGDLALHLDFIRYLARGVPFWPESPILTGEPLKYPLGADFFNALLLAAGLPVEPGLVWAGLAGAALTALALQRWGGGFALAAFLFGGGLAGFPWLREALATGAFTLQDVQAAATWKNPFLTLFVTQRGLLFALPAGLFLLDHWRARYLRGERPALPEWAALLLYATMPLFSVHAFLFLSVALAGTFLFARDAAARRHAVLFTLAALVPSTLAAYLVTGGFASGGGIHLLPGWLQNSEKNIAPAWFWFRNFGLYLVLGAALLGLAIARRDRAQLGVVVPAAAIFLACTFVSFAVWPWDNTKLLLWSWLAVAPGIWSELVRPLPALARALVGVVLFFTGALSLTAGLDGRHGYGLVEIPLLNDTASAVAGIPPVARFAAAPEFAHPLILLGRPVALGFDGHLWSHGLDYRAKMADLDLLMAGDSGWQEAARRLGVDYLYWGLEEEDRYPDSEQGWAKTQPVIAQRDEFTIYRLPSRP